MVMEAPPKLTVRYTLQPSDVYDPFLYSWRNLIRWVTVVFVCLLLYDLASNTSASRWRFGIAPAVLVPVVIGVLIVALFVWPWLKVQMMFRRYPTLGRPRSVAFSSDGMHTDSEDSQGDYKWSLFHRIGESPKAFVFMVTSRGGTYVPKRCLSTAGEIDILRQLIRENFRGKKKLRTD
jgi:YcxB-like protein